MKRKFKLKNLFLISFAALAGIFSLANIHIYSMKDIKDVYTNTKADDYKIVWFCLSCDWGYNKEFYNGDQYYTFKVGNTEKSTQHKFGVAYNSDGCYSEVYAAKLVKIYLPNDATEIRFALDQGWTPGNRDYTIYESILGNESKVYVLDSHTSSQQNQTGHWETYDYVINNYYKPIYFSVTTNWNGGAANLNNFWVWSQLSLRDADGSSSMNTGRQYCCYQLTYRPIITVNGFSYIEVLTPYCSSAKTEQVVLSTEFNSNTNRNKTSNLAFNDWFNEYGKPAYFITTAYTSGSSTQKGYWACYGQKTSYYLIGNGSFLEHDSPWKPSAGINMDVGTDGNNAHLLNQYLKAGDVFGIKNMVNDANPDWMGWSRFLSDDKSHFLEGVKNLAVISDSSRWRDSGACGVSFQNYSDVNGGSGDSNSSYHDIYIRAPQWFWGNSMSSIGVLYKGNDNSDCFVATNEVFAVDGNYKYYKVSVPVTSNPGFEVVRYSNGATGGSYDAYSSWQSNFSGNDNIVVRDTGYYNIYVNSSNNIYISPVVLDFAVGDGIYLDLNNNWSGQTPKVHAWWSGDSSKSIDESMSLSHGHGLSTQIYEWKYSLVNSKKPDMIIFYYGTWAKQTADLSLSGTLGSNMFVLTSENGGYWIENITKEKRAVWYGVYFNQEVVCSGAGSIINDNWSNVRDEYNNMCTNAQGEVWKEEAIPAEAGGTSLQQAVSKYDYIVFHKQYTGHDDYIGRTDSPGKSALSTIKGGFGPFESIVHDAPVSTIIIIIASSVSLLSITALSILLVKKRSSNRKED